MSSALIETCEHPIARSANEVRAYLITELSKSLETEPALIDPAAPLDKQGVDSLMALGMAGGLAGWLDRDIPATLMWDYRSVDAIAEALATAMPARQLPDGVVALQPDGDGVPIFGFPGRTGSPLTFAALASRLGDAQPFYGIAQPGFEDVPGRCTTVEEIAAAMLVMIRQVRPKGPYRFTGYCFGGLLAYEAARQLVAAGEEVSLLAIYDMFTPEGRVARPLWQRAVVHLQLLASSAHHRAKVFDKLRRLLLMKRPKNPEPNYWTEPVPTTNDPTRDLWIANTLAANNYSIGRYTGSAAWFGAVERAGYNAFYKLMPCGGWSLCTAGRVTSTTIPGTHFNLIGPEHAQTTADALRPLLVNA